jgi:hypothetical protein
MNESEFSNTRANGGEGEGQGISAAPQPELLPLDLPERVIMFKSRETGATRRHIFNRLTRADVDAYFSSMTIATERKSGNSMEYHIDLRTNILKLYERTVKRVEGYSLTDGRDMMALANWKDRIPGVHRLRATEILMKVTQSENGADLGIDPEAELVSLDAFWSAGDEGMFHYRGLIHRFSPPTIEHWRKLNNHSTRTTAVGGSQSQRTIYPKLNGIYVELYDLLILSANGYSVGGQPLGGREQCVSQMDTFHKIAAISILFEKPSGGEAEDLEEA